MSSYRPCHQHTNAIAVSLLLLAVVSTFGPVMASDDVASRPNVLVIMADDQGWGDLSLHGNENLQTPYLDSIAQQGAQFRQFFVCPVCAPTRAEFLTGRYYLRTGVRGVTRGEERMNADEVTVADLFQAAGYVTGAFGKWHNGTQPPLHPNHRGFAEFYGFTSGHWSHYFDVPMDRNNQRVRGRGFIADDVTDHAIRFITAPREQPFFCYLAFNTPHSPMMVPDRDYAKFADAELSFRHRDVDKEDPAMTRAALALCENLDRNVGRILKCLREHQLDKRTIVVYFSDNGPNSWRWNGGLKGKKGSIDEGGVKSPLFVKWRGKIEAGQTIDNIAGAIDLLPTLCRLADVPVQHTKPLDGIDLSPVLLKESADLPDRCLFSVRRGQVSVRSQNYRLDAAGRLFNMQQDPGQRQDVSQHLPEPTARLKQRRKDFRQQIDDALEPRPAAPFHLGFDELTMLPARDGIASGKIQRSSKAPNNSYFTNWVSEEDVIEWSVDVASAGDYEFVLLHTCAEESVGVRLYLAAGEQRLQQTIDQSFDPALYDKSKERVAASHYFMKDFRPRVLGRLRLPAGPVTLRLGVVEMPGAGAVDVYSLDVRRVKPVVP